MAKAARIRFQVAVLIQEKGGDFFARCPFLNVTTRGDSPDSAFQNLQEEIQFLLSSAMQDDTIIQLLDHRTAGSVSHSSPDDFIQLEIRTTEFDLPRNIPPHLLKRFADAPDLPA